MEKINIALKFAKYIHKNQKRTNGAPYFIHIKSVYDRVKIAGYDEKHQLVAILHDTIEDAEKPEMAKEFIKRNFSEEILNAVVMLTHRKGENYTEYVMNLYNTNKLAYDVKMMDMLDNISDNPNERQFEKYETAIRYLMLNGAIIPKKLLFILNTKKKELTAIKKFIGEI